MAKQAGIKNYFTFVGGLNTEAGYLVFPDNAANSLNNFDLNRDGSLSRRFGVDYEPSYVMSSAIPLSNFSSNAVTEHQWLNVNNQPDINFHVQQVGTTLYFHDLNSAAVSSTAKSFTVNLNDFAVTGATGIGTKPISAASADGRLYVVSYNTEPFYIEYDEDLDTISTTQYTLYIRDLEGVDDNLASTDTRPTVLSDEHKYNLFNQGWDITKINSYYSSKSKYPSNADIWHIAKDSSDNFDPNELDKIAFGNTPAPKGHYILNVFNRDRATASGITSIPTVTTNKRPTKITFHAGRLFYTGFDANVYFTKTLGNGFSPEIDAGYCYQEADPTSEEISDLIDTDGGVIPLFTSGERLRLESYNQTLFIICDNGIWGITGGDTSTGFKATDYLASRISSVGAIGEDAIVTIDTGIVYWAIGGIYILAQGEGQVGIAVTNISNTTIDSYYSDISALAKKFAKGVYDETQKKVYWVWSNAENYNGITYAYKYNKVLVLDTILQAYYPYTIKELSLRSPYVAGIVKTSTLAETQVTDFVVDSGNSVVDGGDIVTALVSASSSNATTIRFLTVVPQDDAVNAKYTLSTFDNNSWVDWETADGTGVDADGDILTGYEIAEQAYSEKTVPYLFMFFERTETAFTINEDGNPDYDHPSGCLVRSRWEWADSSSTGRWGTQFQAYRLKRLYVPSESDSTFDYGFPVIVTKSKLRGHGRAVTLHFITQAGKSCHILGWTLPITAETSP